MQCLKRFDCKRFSLVYRAQAELLRTTCAVLIRRIVVPSGPHWARLSAPTKVSLRAGLLSAIGKETCPAVARKVRGDFGEISPVVLSYHMGEQGQVQVIRTW